MNIELVYGSVCDGIGAASCAWEPLGLICAWRSEIAAFPSRVTKYHWPSVANLGDFTRIGVDVDARPVDILVGGTPCQSFSVAGGRAGLDDPRGHLAVEFLRLARRLGARWLVWENVPGVFSADDGTAFTTFLGLMVECGYGVAWRVLDAQFFGVPQRRRRVFVVGYLGDWRPPVAVLFERPSMLRDPRSSSPAGTSVAASAGVGADGGVDVGHAITSHHGRNSGEDIYALAFHCTQDPISSDEKTPLISAEESTGAIGVLPIQSAERGGLRQQGGIGVGKNGAPMYTITTRPDHGVFAFDEAQITSADNRSTVTPGEPVPTVSSTSRLRVAGGMRPRRLTPMEVERCFGFPDGFTNIPGASDSARYEALGHSRAVPVMSWIGKRIRFVDSIVGARHGVETLCQPH